MAKPVKSWDELSAEDKEVLKKQFGSTSDEEAKKYFQRLKSNSVPSAKPGQPGGMATSER
ncbi:MAG: hypothetical protein JST40_01645 [Armatimonadetes bacterium]|nr:hypothetical protein [Armatimonadota bacterium]